MIALTFDLGTKMGWAAGDLRGSPDFGQEILGEAGATHGQRFTQALLITKTLIDHFKPDLIAHEATIPSGPKGDQTRSQMAMGYRAACHIAAFTRGVKEPEQVHVSTVRKFFIGNGGVGGQKAKSMAMEHCMDLGWDVENDDQAEALAVWAFTAEKHGFQRFRAYGGLF